MSRLLSALSFATLAALPVATLAQTGDSAAAPAPMPPGQRQAMNSQMQAYREKAMQLHEQLRAQVLDAMSPDHRTAVASAIGEMAISAKPDPAATAKQIDAVLTPEEQQKIVALHDAFAKQNQAMMAQLHAQLTHQNPNMAARWNKPIPMVGANDAGNVVLMVLTHRPPMSMMMMHHGGMPMGSPSPTP